MRSAPFPTDGGPPRAVTGMFILAPRRSPAADPAAAGRSSAAPHRLDRRSTSTGFDVGRHDVRQHDDDR